MRGSHGRSRGGGSSAVIPGGDDVHTCGTGEMDFRTAKGYCVPGAQMSTIEPKLEKSALPSAIFDAATVMTEGSLAGESLAASSSSFPAEATVVTPEATSLAAAALTEATKSPPKLMEATEGRPLLLAAVATQSIPEMLSGA